MALSVLNIQGKAYGIGGKFIVGYFENKIRKISLTKKGVRTISGACCPEK